VSAPDIRSGAALVVAGLCAEGTTMIDNVYHLDRGYEGIEAKLSALGAHITRRMGEAGSVFRPDLSKVVGD
jgi:UDP-N-acetylglucosamine 1-carboxyvinyltransferase